MDTLISAPRTNQGENPCWQPLVLRVGGGAVWHKMWNLDCIWPCGLAAFKSVPLWRSQGFQCSQMRRKGGSGYQSQVGGYEELQLTTGEETRPNRKLVEKCGPIANDSLNNKEEMTSSFPNSGQPRAVASHPFPPRLLDCWIYDEVHVIQLSKFRFGQSIPKQIVIQ